MELAAVTKPLQVIQEGTVKAFRDGPLHQFHGTEVLQGSVHRYEMEERGVQVFFDGEEDESQFFDDNSLGNTFDMRSEYQGTRTLRAPCTTPRTARGPPCVTPKSAIGLPSRECTPMTVRFLQRVEHSPELGMQRWATASRVSSTACMAEALRIRLESIANNSFQERTAEDQPQLMADSPWSTGLFEGELQCRCPCAVVGEIHAHVDGPGGFWGGFVASACCLAPCILAMDAPAVTISNVKRESNARAICCAFCPLTCICYMMQIHREVARQRGVARYVQVLDPEQANQHQLQEAPKQLVSMDRLTGC